MSIKKYTVFAKVVETGSLTRAAEALGLTQSGVSHIISGLEEELGFALLLRSRAGVSLTSDGERVMPAIRGMLNYSEQLAQITAAIHGLDSGTVRVGAFTSVAVHWLPKMIKGFQGLYPNIEFKLYNGDYHDIAQWINEGSVDLGFVAADGDAGCPCLPLLVDRLMAVLPLGHPLAAGGPVPISALRDEPFIYLLENSNQDCRRALDSVGITPEVKFTTKDDYAMIAMVAQGLGVSIMPELMLLGRDGGVAVRELDPPCFRTVALAVPEPSMQSPASRRFADYVVEWVQSWKGAAHAG